MLQFVISAPASGGNLISGLGSISATLAKNTVYSNMVLKTLSDIFCIFLSILCKEDLSLNQKMAKFREHFIFIYTSYLVVQYRTMYNTICSEKKKII